MRPIQKFAWYNMVVVAIIGIVVLVRFIVSGEVSLDMGGIVLFVGSIFIFRYSKDKVVRDERDAEIERQATTAALWAVMIYFTAAGTYITMDFDRSPIQWQSFINFFCGGYVLFFAVASTVIIALFGREKEDDGGFTQSLGELSGMQIEALMMTPFFAAILIIVLYHFPVTGNTPRDIKLGLALQNMPILLFFIFPFYIHRGRAYEFFRPVIGKARRIMLRSTLATAVAGLVIIAAIYLLHGADAVHANLFILTGFCSFSTGSLVYWVCLLFSPALPGESRR